MRSRFSGFIAIVAFAAVTPWMGDARAIDFGGSSSAPAARAVAPSGYTPGTQPPQPQERIVAVDPDKKLSAGDKVTIEIVEDQEAGVPRVVTATGELDVPPLGRVRVAGQTAADAAASIKKLLEKDYYYTATVHLSIDQVATGQVQKGSVLVSGSVRRPGSQMIMVGQPLTLALAVANAGATEWADLRKVQVTRLKNDGSRETLLFNVDKIERTGDAEGLDPVLQDGDRINVPKRPWKL